MTAQLPERLRDLADSAPGPLSATGLWQEGRRRHRRRLVTGLAVVAAVVALTAVAGYGDWSSRRPEPSAPPATPNGPMTIPDHLFNPSPWLPTTRVPGRLVAVMSSTRDRFPFGSDRNAIVGVAAGTQTYRFLELLGQAPEPDVALSPDGRHLAYWVTRDPGDASVVANAVVGIAVLDLTTGSVERHVVPTRYGLAPDTLSWVDSETVAMATDRFTSSEVTSLAGPTRVHLVTVGSPVASELPHSNVGPVPTAAGGGYAAEAGPRAWRTWYATGRVRSDIRTSVPLHSVAYDVSSGRLAGTRARSSTSGPLEVGHVVGHHVRLRVVPGHHVYSEALVWVDPAHVATVRQTRDGLVYDVVDVRTGARRELTSKPWYAFQVARDALHHATTVPAIAPPSPWNPRWVTLAGLLLVAALGGVALVARRPRARS
jgi:hypothetical protein